jgi:hypothetical protein
MFASGHHIVMGSSEDPKDGKGVAAAVFGAVVVYGVRITSQKAQTRAGKTRKRTTKLTSANRYSSSSAAARPSYTRGSGRAVKSLCGRQQQSERANERKQT